MNPRYLGLIPLLIAPLAIAWAAWTWEALEAWIFAMIILAVSIFFAGWLITDQVLGLLIDERNKASLSRFQAVLWTVMILAAFMVIAVQNVDKDKEEPLSVTIPEELLVVMGISATSLVGSPLVKSVKQTTPADRREAERTFRHLRMLPADASTGLKREGCDLVEATTNAVLARGQIAMNPSPSQANLAELFKGEETSNAANLDLGKVQMFYITIALALGYAFSLGKLLDGGAPFDSFPALDESMVALLGISHAAYMTNKVVPRTKTE